jgi:hypothetical protein
MKKTPTNIKPPKRSSSLVTRITRPIIEQQQSQRTISPASSFSSSILAKGMSERMTPSTPAPPPPQKTGNHSSKSNRRRTIDFSRRRTVDGINEHKSNKENLSLKTPEKSPQSIYQFSPLSSNNKLEIHIPSSKSLPTRKYYFHSNSKQTNEDLLNNSYGLTLLNEKSPLQQRYPKANGLIISQIPNQISSQKSFTPRTSIEQHTLDSLDDLLCDREVESYFYPTSSQIEHIYMNLANPLSLSYIHGTLC